MGENGCGGGVVLFCARVCGPVMRERMNKSAYAHVSIPGHHVVSCELPSPAEFGQLTGQGPVPTTARQVDDPEMGVTAACVSWLGDIASMSWDRGCGEPWGSVGSGYSRYPTGTGGTLFLQAYISTLVVRDGWVVGSALLLYLCVWTCPMGRGWRWQVPATWCLFPAGLGVVCGETCCWGSGGGLCQARQHVGGQGF